MILLDASSGLVTPAIGLVFWTTIVFVILFLLLKKFAWKPITEAIREREETIEGALAQAEKAKKEMKELKAANEKILNEARAERDAMLAEARNTKDAIISEAKTKAKSEADKIVVAAQEAIANEKLAAMTELKNQVGILSIEIAEKIIREKLSNDDKQKALQENLLQEVNLN